MKKLLLLSALLIISIFGYTQTAITNANIQTAVDLWISDPSAASTTYGNISDWDVSQVTDMSQLFYHEPNFNDDISNWNVINVTNMNFMFYGASAFNQPVGNWDVSSVTDMGYMFYGATSLNQDISNWDVGNVTDMSWMFHNTGNFVQDISSWCVSNITSEPTGFSNGAQNFPVSYKPVWGTCLSLGIDEYLKNKEVLKVTDLFGRETKQTNQPLFYIYDDGTVEKKLIIE